MSVRVYYRLCLALPLVLPAAAGGVYYLIGPDAAPGVLMLVWLVLLSSLLYGGLPYALLAAALLGWSRDRDEEQLVRSLCLAPVMMLPLLWLFQLLQGALLVLRGATMETYGQSAAEYLLGLGGMLLYLSACVLGLGYAYVAFALAGLFLLKRRECGCWTGAPPSPRAGD